MNKILMLLLPLLLLIAIDYYVFQAIKVVADARSAELRRILYIVYWSVNAITIGGFVAWQLLDADTFSVQTRRFMMVWMFMLYFSKLFAVFFLALDDLVRFTQWTMQTVGDWLGANKVQVSSSEEPLQIVRDDEAKITRSEFLARTSLIAAALPMAGMSYGILSGAHDYRVRRVKIALPNLPKAFDGIRIAQLSDIHSGSFFNKIAVQGGVDMLLAQKPDVIFFTGDLVNNTADEMKDYFDVFKQVKAPLGVYSVLGNHDYGDYVQWTSLQAKQKNLQTLMKTHADMGWQLLINEHQMLKQGNEQIAIIGVENWGAKARFPKYGKLQEAYRGTEEAPVKLLLSHDPSHWDAEVRPEFSDIDIMFAGHTHGMQFGIEIGSFKWSPVQYVYDQWAGLYTQGQQHLYVNRGYGYLGFPGRIGMLPEITIMELVKA